MFSEAFYPETYKPGIVSERVYSGWITFQSRGKELDLYTNCTIWSYSVEKHQYVIAYWPFFLNVFNIDNRYTVSSSCCLVSFLTHYQTTNFRLFQIKKFADDYFKYDEKWQKVIQTVRKHCGKRRNCSLWAISPFPTVFSKGLFPRGVKRCHSVGIG